MDLSIIIVSFNTRDKLRKCLRSIFDSETKYSFEVFVVDNASADGSAAMVEKDFSRVKLTKNSENVGFSRANNIVLRDRVSKYILLLNSDIIVMPDTIQKMMEYMDANSDVGIASCRVEKPDGRLDLASRRSFPDPLNAFF
ncbi:MAG: glycosyltransferase, partial [bacterium]|nr:glycosyltransferase [bacterium]